MSAATAGTTHTILRAEGFSCPSCVDRCLLEQVGRVGGVTAVKVHFASARIEIDHDPAVVSVDELVATVAKAGYTAHPAAFWQFPTQDIGPIRRESYRTSCRSPPGGT